MLQIKKKIAFLMKTDNYEIYVLFYQVSCTSQAKLEVWYV